MTKHILAIDDSLTIRELLTQTLKSAGFQITTANDGVEGLETFASDRYDAVITDVNMPNLDGFGVIEGIRGGKVNRRVPILVLTTESGAALKERARTAGATGWLVKPFDDEGLLNVLRRVTGAGTAT